MAHSCAATLSSTIVFGAPFNHFPVESRSYVRFSPLRLRKAMLTSTRERKFERFEVKAACTSDYSTFDENENTWRGIWSIRNDLEVPSSPYIPVYAQAEEGGPPPMLLGRFQNVLSQLFQHRIIRCGGPVEDDMANIIVAQLLYLDAVDPKKDIIMYLNSPGGSVTAGKSSFVIFGMLFFFYLSCANVSSSVSFIGMAIFDTIRHIRPDVSTVCVGLAAR